jgi:hypothetical protein
MHDKKKQGDRLLGEEEHIHHSRTSGRRQRCRPEFKSLFFMLLILDTIWLIISTTGFEWKSRYRSGLLRETSVFPAISSHTKTFAPNESFYEVFGADQEAAWGSLIPTGGGFVRVDDPERYGLSGGFPLDSSSHGKSESYCVSAFHQLHCLNSIREHMRKSFTSRSLHDHDDLSPQANELHVAHCFDYLRQSIMCCGDLSLEKAVIGEDGKIMHSTNGWNVEHRCKAWDEVFEVTESMNPWA